MRRKILGYSAVAIVTVAMGIGVNTAIVSVIDAVLLKPLPYQKGDQLVMLHKRAEKAGLNVGFSVPEINDYRNQSGSLSELVEYHSMGFTLFSNTHASPVPPRVLSDCF